MIIQTNNNKHLVPQRGVKLPKSESGSTSKPHRKADRKAGSPTTASQRPSRQELAKLQHDAGVLAQFVPFKPAGDWNHAKDVAGFADTWGVSDDYARATTELLAHNLEFVHKVFESGIRYFLKSRGRRQILPLSALTLPEKVALLTEVLPPETEPGYTLRFTSTIARILWYHSELNRMTAHPGTERWLFPFYTVADCLAGAALELQESLECEHPDYDASEARFSFWPELDDDQAEPPSDDSIVQSARGQKASRRRPPGL